MKGWNYSENITQTVSLLDVTPKKSRGRKSTSQGGPSSSSRRREGGREGNYGQREGERKKKGAASIPCLIKAASKTSQLSTPT